jgi:hypothetical protein
MREKIDCCEGYKEGDDYYHTEDCMFAKVLVQLQKEGWKRDA